MQFIQFPLGRIIVDVFADFRQIILIPDNVLPIIALPQTTGKRRPPRMFDAIPIASGGHRLESLHDIRQGQPHRRGRPPCLPWFRMPQRHWACTRAATEGRPDGVVWGCFGNDDDSVNVVGHYDKFRNIDPWIMGWNLMPHHLNHVSCRAWLHFPFYYLSKETFPILAANGHEIRSGLGVIVIAQANGAAMANFRVEFHCFVVPTIFANKPSVCSSSFRMSARIASSFQQAQRPCPG